MAASVDNRRHFPRRLPPAFPAVLPFTAANHHLFNSTHHDDDDDDEDDPTWWKPYLPTHADLAPTHPDPRDEFTADAWIPRNPTLIRLTGKHPFNSEPPLSALMHHGFLTPTPIHYVRNHGPVPRADWSTWTIDISGLVRSPAKITMDQLLHSFPSVDLPVTLVCAGNRRREQNMCRQTNGFNWGPAAVSTSVWRGVRLRDVLIRCGVMRRQDGALNVCFEGAEDLPGGGGSRYGTSLRREVAMDPARDVLLAYMQNGELLAPDHGFPVRVIIPGFIGGRMVKWLKRVMVTTAESDSYYHYRDNRVLPSHVDAELANAEAWWYKPEYIINELNINSVITTPGHDDVLPINSVTTQNPYTIKGYAYSGGGKKVTRVEITLDGGETWQVCTLDHPEKPTKYGKYWCWCFWSIDIEVLHLLGAKELAVRAWDESLNTQPEKLIWNLMGMMNNCWFRVRLSACRPRRGELGLLFEHPTLPGNLPGGWMARQKHLDVDSAASGGSPRPALKKSLSSPFMSTSPATFSISEVRRHSTSKSAWIVVHGHVYDCTGFLKDHPGGADSIVINAGSDCTEEFDAIHSDRARSLLDTYRIGELISTGYTSDASVHGGSSNSNLATIRELIALSDPREKVQIRLVEKTAVSRDVRRLRFALPSPEMTLGLPVGKHVFLCAYVDGKLCMRAYTPTSPADEVGCVELVIRVYFKGEDPRFPDGGVMSQYLESLDVGAMVEMKGPVGHVEYVGRGGFVVGGDDQRRVVRRMAAVAGGTGITPVYGVMQAVRRDQPGDETEVWLVYACRTEEDIMMREELDGWVREGKGRVRVKYVVGRIGEEVMREHLPEGGDAETVALVCGPPGMVKEAVVPVLEKMKYDLGSSIVIF